MQDPLRLALYASVTAHAYARPIAGYYELIILISYINWTLLGAAIILLVLFIMVTITSSDYLLAFERSQGTLHLVLCTSVTVIRMRRLRLR